VTFTAQSKDKEAGNPLIEVQLPGHEFVRCWSLHILPKGLTKSRSYGSYHPSQRPAYLGQYRRLLPRVDTPSDASGPSESCVIAVGIRIRAGHRNVRHF
jgi:Putative transposase